VRITQEFAAYMMQLPMLNVCLPPSLGLGGLPSAVVGSLSNITVNPYQLSLVEFILRPIGNFYNQFDE
jgi:hypothetical protein